MFRIQIKLLAGLILVLLGTLTTSAQDARTCGTYQATQEMAAKNLEYAKQLETYLASLQAVSGNDNARLQLTSKTVPVVVHIIYSNINSNISEAQVFDAIEVLNKDFNK